MARINTPNGIFQYKPKFVYLGVKRINPEIAFENLSLLVDVLNKARIPVSPAYGSLLGIIRENGFIEWDEDIDLFILKEDKEKFLNALWDLKKVGFDLIRDVRVGHLYSVIRKGEYVDFYIMDSVTPEIRTTHGGGFVFEKYLKDLIDWDFNGLTIKVPREYEECLEFMYGDWRTPIQYANFEQSAWKILTMRVAAFVKKLIPPKIHLFLLDRYHRKDLDKFLLRCQNKGIELKYPIK